MRYSTTSSRRALLRAVGVSAAAGIAGCIGQSGSQTYGLVVVNYRDSSQKISVTVTRKDTAETLLDEAYTLSSDGRTSEESVFQDPATYTVSAKTATGITANTDFTVHEDQPPVDSFHVHLTAEGELNLFLPVP